MELNGGGVEGREGGGAGELWVKWEWREEMKEVQLPIGHYSQRLRLVERGVRMTVPISQ